MHEGRAAGDAQLAQISQRFKRIPVSAMQRSREQDKKLFLGVLSFMNASWCCWEQKRAI